MRLTEKQKIWGMRIFKAILILLSFLASVKTIFLGIDVDEQYAITVAYRIATGEEMFRELWDLHQTSSFLSALLVKLFISLTGGTEYLVIYLRVAGTICQLGIAIFLYRTLKLICPENTAFMAAVFFFNTLPKWSQIPEFGNQLIWFSVLNFLLLLRFYVGGQKGRRLLVVAALSASAMTVSYPSSALVAFFCTFGIWKLSGGARWKNSLIYMGTCGVCGAAYIMYFLSHMTLSEFIEGIGWTVGDTSHSETGLEMLPEYASNVVRWLPHVLGIASAAGIIALLLGRIVGWNKEQKRNVFGMLLIMAACVEQGLWWLFCNSPIQIPMVYSYLTAGVGMVIAFRAKRKKEGLESVQNSCWWFGCLASVAVLCAVLIVSNTQLFYSGQYMMVGLLATIVFLSGEAKRKPILWWGTMLCLVGICLFAKGFMVYQSGGLKSDVRVVKQKALSGPLKGIYCRYLDGYAYNEFAELSEEYIPDGSKVLYIGEEMLRYMQGDFEISAFTTISSSVFNERYLEYWKLYPDKFPEYVVTEGITFWEAVQEAQSHCELLAQGDSIAIYKVP